MTSDRKPSEIYDVPDVSHFKVDIQEKYLKDFDAEKEGGKWLMFIEKSQIDKKWEEICAAYDMGLLTGIYQLKCSTSYKNPRASNTTHGAIRFYCGPASDQKKVIEYGKNVLKFIKYESNNGFMYYKTNEQSRTGTRALGQLKNSTYCVPVPRSISHLSVVGMRESMSNRKPSEVDDIPDIYHLKDDIQKKYLNGFDAEKEGGKWLMFIEKSELDKKWEEACAVYDKGVLDGIYVLNCSTNYKHMGMPFSTKGVIRFYCGPASNAEKIMKYGQNILKWIKYENEKGFMYYKTNEQTRAASRFLANSCYRIPVPKISSATAVINDQMQKLNFSSSDENKLDQNHSQ